MLFGNLGVILDHVIDRLAAHGTGQFFIVEATNKSVHHIITGVGQVFLDEPISHRLLLFPELADRARCLDELHCRVIGRVNRAVAGHPAHLKPGRSAVKQRVANAAQVVVG